MKVIYLSPSFYPATKYGGPIFSTLNTCRELFKLGVNLDIHTTNVDRKSRLDIIVNKPVKVKELDNNYVTYHKENITDKFSLDFFLKVPIAIKNSDIVHTQSIFSMCTPLSILWSKFFKKNTIISPRGSLGPWCLTQGSRFKKIWLRLLFQPFLENIYWHVTAEDEKADVLSVFPNISDSKFIIIPNGVNKEHHEIIDREILFHELDLDVSNGYILSSGRIDDKKGFDYTIRALEFIDGIDLLIMGEDYGSKQALIELAKKVGVASRVKFLGHISDKYKWSLYAHAAVFSLNSRHENFGNVYLESLSVGTPIIASVYTPWAFINNTHAGACIDNCPEKIANTINAIIANPEYSKEECYAVVKDFYWDEIARQFISEYERVINDN
ncbi:glycosyltransferase [Photobacterium damselae]